MKLEGLTYIKMNRLAVYSYLTRYPYICTLGLAASPSSDNRTTGQEDNSAPTTAFTGSDVGLDTARVR